MDRTSVIFGNPIDEKTIRKYHKKSGLPLKRFFNTSGMLYRELELAKKLQYMLFG